MLMNPKWLESLWARPSVASFEAWLGRQDPSRTYTWSDPDRCACAQYAAEMGWFGDWREEFQKDPMWDRLNTIAQGPRTFGTLLSKLKRVKV